MQITPDESKDASSTEALLFISDDQDSELEGDDEII